MLKPIQIFGLVLIVFVVMKAKTIFGVDSLDILYYSLCTWLGVSLATSKERKNGR